MLSRMMADVADGDAVVMDGKAMFTLRNQKPK